MRRVMRLEFLLAISAFLATAGCVGRPFGYSEKNPFEAAMAQMRPGMDRHEMEILLPQQAYFADVPSSKSIGLYHPVSGAFVLDEDTRRSILYEVSYFKTKLFPPAYSLHAYFDKQHKLRYAEWCRWED